MELPTRLRRAVDQALEGVPLVELTQAVARLSDRYRGETMDGALHISSDLAAKAYIATRLPATYAAVREAMATLAELRPDFHPKRLLDVGSGPGTVLWAAADCWPDLADALLVEASPVFRTCGEALAREASVPHIAWRIVDVAADTIDCPPRDLVTLAYALNELAPEVRQPVLRRLWQATADTLVIVEPGTPAGWQRIVAARAQLIEAGAHVLAPCPHAHACPLEPPDWCHFAERVARSRLHRLAKEAELPWEDEKFSYVAFSRTPSSTSAARVIARARKGSGRVTLKLCRDDGSAREQLFSRRDGTLFKRAWRSDWGSAL